MQTSINENNGNRRGYDDNYQRAESSPIRNTGGAAPAEISPFDHNPNPGASLPEWRQFGFESEEAYN